MAVSRLGITPFEFYQMTPVEFYWAIEDHEEIHFTPMKRICETVRHLMVVVHNNTPGRKKHQVIRKPQKLLRFSWEKPKIQTVEEMKSIILGLAGVDGVQVTQNGKPVKPPEPKMRRTK